MKILIDTNVLISAALNRNSTTYKAYVKATSFPNKGVICDQNIDEMRYIFTIKFPDCTECLNHFLSQALSTLELISTPVIKREIENKIRDLNDRPILRAAIAAKVDMILTGDRDFLESGITDPIILSPSEFLNVSTLF